MNIKNLLYALACISFTVVIGAAVYEHIAVVPQWSAAPPASLGMFQGKYPLNAAPFWISIHPVTLLLSIASLIICWKTPRRKHLLVLLGGYVLVLAVTSIYFVPELINITGTPFSETPDAALTERAKSWEMLSMVRLFFLVGLAVYFLLGLTKPPVREIQQ